jgi:hypothetical protein
VTDLLGLKDERITVRSGRVDSVGCFGIACIGFDDGGCMYTNVRNLSEVGYAPTVGEPVLVTYRSWWAGPVRHTVEQIISVEALPREGSAAQRTL